VNRDLAQVAAVALAVLEPGGVLAFATNSTKVSVAELDRALGEGAAAARADLRVFQRIGLPPDYPVGARFPRGQLPQAGPRRPSLESWRRKSRRLTRRAKRSGSLLLPDPADKPGVA